MASETQIANMALTLLGETRKLASLADDTTAARELRAAFGMERDAELRRHLWNFAKTRLTLAPLATPPAFGFGYAYQMPADWLRFVPGADSWPYSLEGGQLLTDAGPALNILYIRRVEEPGQFDALFVRALAARLAMATCLSITGSSERRDGAAADYRMAIADARQVDAVENEPDDQPLDDWVLARERE